MQSDRRVVTLPTTMSRHDIIELGYARSVQFDGRETITAPPPESRTRNSRTPGPSDAYSPPWAVMQIQVATLVANTMTPVAESLLSVPRVRVIILKEKDYKTWFKIYIFDYNRHIGRR